MTLADFFIKKETLEIMLKVINAKNQQGISLQIGINDETNQWGQNVSVSVSQTKEEREAKKDKYYVGNGKVFYTDGKITKAEKKDIPKAEEPFIPSGDTLPFQQLLDLSLRMSIKGVVAETDGKNLANNAAPIFKSKSIKK